jgi:glycosyltransferase involved in cell wall biosynthesis
MPSFDARQLLGVSEISRIVAGREREAARLRKRLAIDAAHRASRILGELRDLPVHGVIAGGAQLKKQAYLEEIQALSESSGLKDRVTFTGNRSDLKNILAISDVVLSLTSQPESFGRTTLEALSLGVPVAGYDHGGVGEQLDLLFPAGKIPPGDCVAAVKTLRQFLETRPSVPESHPFTLQRMLDQTVEVYQELLGSARV